MKERTKTILIATPAAAIGGALGAVSGSNSWVVVALVSAFFGAFLAWTIRSFVR